MTVERLISGWTDRHVPVALALVAAVLGGVIAMAEPAPHHLVAVGAVVATVLMALFVDAFGGLVVGVAVAAVTVAVKQLRDEWTPRAFGTSLALVVVLTLLGWLVGMVSGGIHRSRATGDGASGALAPAYGSLGLLTAEVALARLDEEVARARRHRRPLTVVVLRVRITDGSLDDRARTAARRTVARLVETLLRDTDVPFDLTPEEFGAILPETGGAAAWDVIGPVLDAASRAAFTVREEDERRSLVECAELHAGLALLGGAVADADSLVAAARRSAEADELESRPANRVIP
jgi:GGDEF domain-containing protein